MTQIDIDRQPLLVRNGRGAEPYHVYDENRSAIERFNHGVTIRRYVRKQTRRPTRWQIGVIQEDDAAGEDYWIGGVTHHSGVYNAYIRGSRNTTRRVEVTGLPTENDALDALRWAIAHLYP